MNSDWPIKKIGDVCDLMTGGTPSRTKPEYFDGGSIKWLVSGDIHLREITDCSGRITMHGLQNSNAKYLPVNSVMIALNGQGKTRGTVALLRTRATCNQSMVSIFPKDQRRLLPEYIYANLHGRYEEIRRITGDDGNDRRGLNMTLVRSIELPIAPIEEQKRIVAILDEAFAAIATATANAETNLANARELLKSYLNVVFRDKSAAWSACPLAEVLERITYGFTNPMPTTEEGPWMVTAKNVNGGRIIYEQARHTSRTAFDTLLTDKSRPKIGDVLLTKDGTLGRLGVVDRGDICVNQSVAVLRPTDQIDPQFLKYLLSSPEYQERMVKDAGGTTIKHIYITRVDKMTVRFPSLPEQGRIVERVEACSAKFETLKEIVQQKRASLVELKQSILHKAFTGELTAEPRASDRTLSRAGP